MKLFVGQKEKDLKDLDVRNYFWNGETVCVDFEIEFDPHLLDAILKSDDLRVKVGPLEYKITEIKEYVMTTKYNGFMRIEANGHLIKDNSVEEEPVKNEE
jgi:hypothetical protein